MSEAESETVEVVRGFVTHDDGSQSPVERWVRASDDRWVSLDSERQTRRDLTWVMDDHMRRGPFYLDAQALAILGYCVATVRRNRGLSYRQLSDATGVLVSTLHKVEHGGDPRLSTIVPLLKWLNEKPA